MNARNVASVEGVCSLSANQIGCYSSFFVVLNRNKIVANKWLGYKNGPADYDVVVNPKIESLMIDQSFPKAIWILASTRASDVPAWL